MYSLYYFSRRLVDIFIIFKRPMKTDMNVSLEKSNLNRLDFSGLTKPFYHETISFSSSKINDHYNVMRRNTVSRNQIFTTRPLMWKPTNHVASLHCLIYNKIFKLCCEAWLTDPVLKCTVTVNAHTGCMTIDNSDSEGGSGV